MKIFLDSKWNRIMDCAVIESNELLVTACDDHTLKVFHINNDFRQAATLIKHKAPVRSCAATKDGRRVVSVSSDRSIIVWDMDKYSACDHIPNAHATRILSCALSADGAILATSSEDGTIRIWEPFEKGYQLKDELLNQHSGRISDSAISEDGSLLITGGEDGILKIWDLKDITPFQRPLDLHEKHRIIGCAISADRQLIVSVSSNSRVQVVKFNSDVGEYLPFDNKGHSGKEVRCCSISDDNTRLIIGAEDGIFKIFEISQDGISEIYHCHGHKDTIRWCYYSQQMDAFFTAGEDALIKMWNAPNYSIKKVVYAHAGPIQTQVYDAGADLLIYTLGDRKLSSFFVHSETETSYSKKFKSRVTALELINDTLVVGTEHGSLHFLTIVFSKKYPKYKCNNAIKAICALGTDHLLVGMANGDLAKIKVGSVSLDVFMEFPDRGITTLCARPDGNGGHQVCCGTYEGFVLLFDLENSNDYRPFKISDHPIWHAAFSTDGQKLALFSKSPGLTLFDIATGQVEKILVRDDAMQTSGEFSPDGQFVLTSSFDHTLRIIDVSSGRTVAEFRAEGALHSAAWLKNDQPYVISGLGNYGRYLLQFMPQSHDHF